MAAVTVANRQETVFGNKRVVIADLSSIDNNDTWDTGLLKCEGVYFTPTAAAATTQMGATRSAGIVTFKCESGSLAANAVAIGV